MAINNINTLVDKEILDKINSSDTNNNYILKYYNEALANLGQRNIEDRQLKVERFSLSDLANISNNYVKYDRNGFDINEFNEILDSPASNNDILSKKAKLMIIVNLYKSLKEELGNLDIILFVQKNYLFEYVCDGVDVNKIYYNSKDVYVTIGPSISTIELDSSNFVGIYCQNNNQSYSKTQIYDYSFDYINGDYKLTINKKYTLPFINSKNNWEINDKDTNIQARSKDAMNLNVVLLKSNIAEESIVILSGLNKAVYFSDIDIEEVGNNSNDKIWCKSPNGLIFSINVYLPKIDISEDLSIEIDGGSLTSSSYDKVLTNKILANSTLVVLSKVNESINRDNNSIKQDIIGEYGDGYITTIWNYNVNDKKYEYIYIDTDNVNNTKVNIALDLVAMTDFTNLIKSSLNSLQQLHPDNFTNRWLLFNSINKSIKQSTDTEELLYYPILYNIKGTEYNNKYFNNFNFSLRYINKIKGVTNKNIEKVYNTGDSKYLQQNSNSQNSISVTNALYYNTKTNNTISNYVEYIPNYDVPVFDLSEVLVKDFNVMNRQNILSFTSEGNMYYSYIGTSFDSFDKATLHIGTSNVDINLGEDTLISKEGKTKFLTQNKLSLDFDKVEINGQTTINRDTTILGNVYHTKPTWIVSTVESKTIRSTSIVPKFKYITDSSEIYEEVDVSTMEDDLIKLTRNLVIPNKNQNYLYMNIILKYVNDKNISYYYKYNDLLCIDNFLRYLGLDSNNITISSNTNDIIYDSSNKPIYMISSSNKLSDYVNIEMSNNRGININMVNIPKYFIGNTLDLILEENNNGEKVLTINEHKSRQIQSIWKLPSSINI